MGAPHITGFLKPLLWLVLATSILTSCEQVIDVDLNDASPRYVIEGTITNGNNLPQVRVTQTKNFDESNSFGGITDAEVVLSDNRGHTEILAHADSGHYLGNEIAGIPGRTYTLTVTIDEETFTASSTMPFPVAFEHLMIDSLSFFGETFLVPTPLYEDPEAVKNYYRHILFINDRKINAVFVSSDEGYNGSFIDRGLYYEGLEDLAKGDTVTVEMQSISEASYNYFDTLTQTINRSAASPANPTSNLSGGALGYFSAHTIQRRTIIL